MYWNMISAISAAFMAGIIFFAAVFAYKQFKESTKANKLTAFLELIKYIQDEKVREARRVLIEELGEKKKDYQEWDEKEKKQVEIACHAYNFAGLMEEQGLIKKDFVATNWRRSIVKCWESAQPMIEKYKKEREKDYLDHFKMLYERAKEIDESLD